MAETAERNRSPIWERDTFPDAAAGRFTYGGRRSMVSSLIALTDKKCGFITIIIFTVFGQSKMGILLLVETAVLARMRALVVIHLFDDTGVGDPDLDVDDVSVDASPGGDDGDKRGKLHSEEN